MPTSKSDLASRGLRARTPEPSRGHRAGHRARGVPSQLCIFTHTLRASFQVSDLPTSWEVATLVVIQTSGPFGLSTTGLCS
jgi:hypothetical protein